MTSCLDEAALIAFASRLDISSARVGVERHLDSCPSCREVLAELSRQGLLASSGGDAPTVPDGPEPKEPLVPGANLGRYLVLEPVGQGSWGAVFSAYDSTLRRKVALKVSSAKAGASEQNQVLVREAQAIAKLRHPSVVSVYDVGTVEDRVFIAMELMPGGTLHAWLRAQKRGWREVLDVFIRAGEGLRAAHDAGLVHRDFKPSNVLMGEEGRACLTDFGLSTALEGALTGAVNASTLAGTPRYMAPEQLLGAHASARTDQFSFAVALYEGVVGALPFAGDDVHQLREAMSRGLPREQLRLLPRPLQRVLARALAVAPGARFESMAQLLAALRSAARARRRAASWAAALVLSAAAATAVGQHTLAQRACEQEAGQLDALWNDDADRALGERFRRTGLSFAESSFLQVQRQLSAFKQQWAELSQGTCRAARSGDLALEDAGRRRDCLRDQRFRFAAALQLLKETDASSLEGAPRLAHALPRPAECRSAGVMVGAVREDLHAHAARAWALGQAKRFKEMEASLSQLEAGLAGASSPVFEGELHYLRGRSMGGLRQAKDARKELEEAILIAHASGQDLLLARSYVALAPLVGLELGKREEAQQLFRYAEAASARLGPSSVRPALYLEWARFRSLSGDVAGARAMAEQAVSEATRYHGEQSRELTDALDVLGQALMRAGDLSAALETQDRALALKEGLFGPAHPEVAVSLTIVAHSLRQQMRYDEAGCYLERAWRIRAAATGENNEGAASLLASIANLEYSRGHLEEAQAVWRRVHEIRFARLDPGDPELVRTLTNQSLVADAMLRFEEGALYRQQALALLTGAQAGMSLQWTYVMSQEARSLYGRGQLHSALKHIREVNAALSSVRGPDTPDSMRARWDEADILRELGKPGDALAILEELRPLILKWYGPSNDNYGDLLARMGVCRAMLGAHAAAVADLEEGLRLSPQARQSSTFPVVATAALALSLSRTGGSAQRVEDLRERVRAEPVRLSPVLEARVEHLLAASSERTRE